MIRVSKSKLLLLFFGILLLGAVGVFLNSLVFRQTSFDTDTSRVPTSAIYIRCYFSQPLKSVGSVTIGGKDIENYTIENNAIVIPLKGIGAKDDNKKDLIIRDILSATSGSRIDEFSNHLRFAYVDYKDLSHQQQKDQVNKSSSGEINDPFLYSNVFPIIDSDYVYRIDIASTADEVINLSVTFLDEVPNYDNGGTSTQLPDDVAEKYRTEVIKKIKSRGGSPEKYIIIYSNNYLNTKYLDSKYIDKEDD